MRWLMKGSWFWGGTGLILVALVTGYLLIPVSEGRINKSKFDKIQLGMSEDQVEDLLGADEMLGALDFVILRQTAEGKNISGTRTWSDEDGNRISVAIRDNRVTGKEFAPSKCPFVERIKHRIELR